MNDMQQAVSKLGKQATISAALDELSGVPGMRLVMATKVFRFCHPTVGAALDRHTSYFFNSLDVVQPDGTILKATKFRREWTTGAHTRSRLAIYQPNRHNHNRDEFVNVYLPFLESLSAALNDGGVLYTCGSTGSKRKWRPTDVEMAAFYWWALNGSR